MMLLTHDQFIVQLVKLFEQARDARAVYLTQKRMSNEEYRSAKKIASNTDANEPSEYASIWRASSGNVKFSTLVEPDQLAKFLLNYTTTVRAQATALKKREKKRKRAPGAKNTTAGTG